jgi:hypothetical protein
MLLDKNLQFSNAQAVTSSALSTNAIDLLAGATNGSASAYSTPASIIGNASVFGEDFGIGSTAGVPRVVGTAIAAFTAGGAATLQIAFQGAQDSGSGTLNGYSWVTYAETDAIAVTALTISTRIFSFDWPHRQVAAALPRFVVLNYVVATGPMLTGKVTADVAMGGDDGQATLVKYPSNFTVAA